MVRRFGCFRARGGFSQKCGDDFVLKTYERLTPLKPLPVLKAGATSELASSGDLLGTTIFMRSSDS